MFSSSKQKIVKLKSIPKHIEELLEITEKPIRLTSKPKYVKLKSDKKIVEDIDKLLKEVNTIIKKQKRNGSLTMIQVRSEIFNRLLKEAEKQFNAGELSVDEYLMVVIKLNEGDLKTAESYLMGPSQIKEIDKLIKHVSGLRSLVSKGKITKQHIPIEITEEYLMSLPRTKKGTVNKASKEFKALPVDKKILAINLTKPQPKRSSFAEEIEEVEIDDDYLMNLPKTKTGLISRASKQFKALTKDLQERALSLSNKPRTEAKKTKQAEAKAKLTARNKADKQSGQLKVVKSKTLEEAKAEIEAKKKALEEKKKAEASKPSAMKEAETKLKTDLKDFAMSIRRLPELSSISKLTEAERYSAKNALSDAFSNKRVASETVKQIKYHNSLPEERIIELMDIYDTVQNIELLKKYKELI